MVKSILSTMNFMMNSLPDSLPVTQTRHLSNSAMSKAKLMFRDTSIQEYLNCHGSRLDYGLIANHLLSYNLTSDIPAALYFKNKLVEILDRKEFHKQTLFYWQLLFVHNFSPTPPCYGTIDAVYTKKQITILSILVWEKFMVS